MIGSGYGCGGCQHPGRFGFFASVPLPDVDGAVAAATYALDTLHADGVLLANARGSYLGDPAFEPLMSELDARRAVVFVYPADLPGPAMPGIPPFAADFLLDTTRAAYNLVAHDVPGRYRRVRFILAHAGGFVPYAAHRMAISLAGDGVSNPAEPLDAFRSFYFDTALSGSPTALPSLLAFAHPGHVLFGSDWPFAPAPRRRLLHRAARPVRRRTGRSPHGNRSRQRRCAVAAPEVTHRVESGGDGDGDGRDGGGGDGGDGDGDGDGDGGDGDG